MSLSGALKALGVLALLVVVFVGVGMAAGCKPATQKDNNGDTVTPQGTPPGGDARCTIDQRGQNSKGQWYIHWDCLNDNENGALVLNAQSDYAVCVVGAFYPTCKEQ